MSACPFCKSSSVIPVNNTQGEHWMFCTDCKAGGPHMETAEAAVDAFVVKPEPKRRRFLGIVGG